MGVAGRGVPPLSAEVISSFPVAKLALRERKTAAVADVETRSPHDPSLAAGRDALLGIGVRAVLAAPIIFLGDLIGVLVAQSTTRRSWTREDVLLLEAIARELGVALRSASLLEENRRRLEQREDLLAATEALAAELELHSALAEKLAGGRADLFRALSAQAAIEECVRQARSLLDADGALMLELDGSMLLAREGVGEGIEAMRGRTFRPPSRSRATSSTRAGRSPSTTSRRSAGIRGALDPAVPEGFGALLGVPISRSDDSLDGVLIVYSRSRSRLADEGVRGAGPLAANPRPRSPMRRSICACHSSGSRALRSSPASPTASWRSIASGGIVLWNAAAERITGVASGEHSDDPAPRCSASELEAGAEQGERSFSIKRGDRELWLEVTEATMRDPAGQIAGKIYTLRDVSTDRFVERAKTDFVSSVSHELRAPLTSIYGFAETLLRRGELFDEPQRQTFLAYIAPESERLTGIVDALLDVAQLDAGDLQVELAADRRGEVVREVVESARAPGRRPATGTSSVSISPASLSAPRPTATSCAGCWPT